MSNVPKNSFYFQQGQQNTQPSRTHYGARAPKPTNGGDPIKVAVVQGQDAYYSASPPKPPGQGAPSGQPQPGQGPNAQAVNPSVQRQTPSFSYSSPQAPNNREQPNYFGLNDRVEVRITTDRWVAALIIGSTAIFDKARMAWTQEVRMQDEGATRGNVGFFNLENIRRPARK